MKFFCKNEKLKSEHEESFVKWKNSKSDSAKSMSKIFTWK
jgi:hypothetical protein